MTVFSYRIYLYISLQNILLLRDFYYKYYVEMLFEKSNNKN